MRRIILDLFAGPGGWNLALTVPGTRDIGLEWDSCKTRARVVQLTIQTDAAPYTVWIFTGRIPGLTASQPCQAWSMAGKRLGLLDQPLVRQEVSDLAAGRAGGPPVYHPEQALLGALLPEPQRLTNMTGSGPDAFSSSNGMRQRW